MASAKMTAISAITERIRFREAAKLTLPKEHGSWSLALEPVVLGMAIAPSAAGGAIACSAVAGFFLRRPLKLVLSGKLDSRISLALGVLIGLSLITVAGVFLAAVFGGMENLWFLTPSAIAGIGFSWFDSRNEGREEAAELCGVIAFGVLPAAFGKLAGWSITESAALALIMLVRSVPTVLFVRTYLRRNKGHTISLAPALIASLLGFFLTACLVVVHLVPWPVVVLAAYLVARTFWVLEGSRRFTAKKLGFGELIFGIIMILILAATWSQH